MRGDRGKLLDLVLPELKIPTLGVFGAKSRAVHPMTAKMMEKRLEGRGVQTVMIPDCGHWPALEKPKELADACLAFLRSSGRASGTSTVG